jgi:hypothetical protein
MRKDDKKLNEKIAKVLKENALLLFDSEYNATKFDYQRHICSKIAEIPGKNKTEKIENSIIIAISLFNSWIVHIEKSAYPYNWYGCVQIEEEWYSYGKNTPPYVVFNSLSPELVKNCPEYQIMVEGEYPLFLKKLPLLIGKNIIAKIGFFEDDGVNVIRLSYN